VVLSHQEPYINPLLHRAHHSILCTLACIQYHQLHHCYSHFHHYSTILSFRMLVILTPGPAKDRGPSTPSRPEVLGVNVAEPHPTQPHLINTQHTSADRPMFFQPKNPSKIFKPIILNAQPWTTRTLIPIAYCNPYLDYSLENNRKSRQS
jgi:hypothetical protein